MTDPAENPAHVLVIDDEPTIIDLVARMLRRSKLPVIGVGSGEEGLVAIEKHRPIVVLTDKNLPGMNGLELIRAGRGLVPDAEFIVMTGYASLDSALDAIELGVFAYLTKPFTRQQLTEHVTTAAEHVKKRRATADALARMRADAKESITWPFALRQGLGELDDVVHNLERLVSSLAGVLKSGQSQSRGDEAEEHLAELSAVIARLSELKSQLNP